MSLLNGFDISVQGVSAQTNRLASIGNNIANVATTGYKATDVAFETVLGDTGGSYQGSGVQSATRLNASAQGSIVNTPGMSTNLAVSGNGYFVVQTSTGATALTRAGAFTRQSDGTLVNTAGGTLLGTGASGSSVSVATDGAISVTTASGTTSGTSVPLAQVRSPENLTALTGDTYQANDLSGPMQVSQAGTSGLGTVAGGSLERSTADLATQLTDMITTQRGYEANSKVMQATSDMLSKLSDL